MVFSSGGCGNKTGYLREDVWTFSTVSVATQPGCFLLSDDWTKKQEAGTFDKTWGLFPAKLVATNQIFTMRRLHVIQLFQCQQRWIFLMRDNQNIFLQTLTRRSQHEDS